ncbi:MAG: hypothetical protein HC806_01495 [Anaerolineae bacterium]|nr:hypothetical protein [Anaerolineae bacterium]
MYRKIIFLFLTSSLMLVACLPLGELEVGIEPASGETQIVVTAIPDKPTQAPTAVVAEEPTPAGSGLAQLGTVAGKVCFPSEVIPPMSAFFRNAATGQLSELTIAENQSSFRIELPVGTYEAFAYLYNSDGGGGSYSQYVLCGLSVDCVDHELIAFDVQPNQTTENVDICDWYEPLAVPVNPRATFLADPSLIGLVYLNLTANSLWRVGENGLAAPVLAFADLNTIISPDGKQALYYKNDDVWVGDLALGTWTNLTQTPDRVEYPAAWVPGTEWVALSSYGLEQDASGSFFPPDALQWQLTLVRLDGSGYAVVDPDAMWGAPAASPNGAVVAYDVGGQPRLYRPGTGVESFDPTQFGLTGVEKISAPAFSPDGTKLAWWVGGLLENAEWRNALAIFDLKGGGYTLLHPLCAVGRGRIHQPDLEPKRGVDCQLRDRGGCPSRFMGFQSGWVR